MALHGDGRDDGGGAGSVEGKGTCGYAVIIYITHSMSIRY